MVQAHFLRIVEQSFRKEVAQVRGRGLDPVSLDMTQTKSAAERTMVNAIKKGS